MTRVRVGAVRDGWACARWDKERPIRPFTACDRAYIRWTLIMYVKSLWFTSWRAAWSQQPSQEHEEHNLSPVRPGWLRCCRVDYVGILIIVNKRMGAARTAAWPRAKSQEPRAERWRDPEIERENQHRGYAAFLHAVSCVEFAGRENERRPPHMLPSTRLGSSERTREGVIGIRCHHKNTTKHKRWVTGLTDWASLVGSAGEPTTRGNELTRVSCATMPASTVHSRP